MRALFFLAASLLIFAGEANAGGIDESRVAADALADEDYQIAILHYTAALRARDLPQDQFAMTYRQRGIAYFQTKRTDLAILDFTSALWLDGLGDDVMTKTYYNRGLAYEALGESKLAIADLTAAIERNPAYAEAYNSRGHVYRELHDYDQALADFTASYRQGNPEPHLPMYGMALTYEAMGKREEAKSWYSRALTMKPDFAPALEKLHPDQVAMDAAPVPAIESEALLPGSESKTPELSAQLRKDKAEEEFEFGPQPVQTDSQPTDPNIAADDGGPLLLTEAESRDTLPTLIDEPVPDRGDVVASVPSPPPEPRPKPVFDLTLSSELASQTITEPPAGSLEAEAAPADNRSTATAMDEAQPASAEPSPRVESSIAEGKTEPASVKTASTLAGNDSALTEPSAPPVPEGVTSDEHVPSLSTPIQVSATQTEPASLADALNRRELARLQGRGNDSADGEASKPQRLETAALTQGQSPGANTAKEGIAPAEPERQTAALSPTPVQPPPAKRAEGDYEIQLGAYASATIAEREAKRIKTENADLLANLGHEVHRASVGTKTYFRLRGIGLARADAIDLCKALRTRAVSCIVSRP